jgi:hypothetical protein
MYLPDLEKYISTSLLFLPLTQTQVDMFECVNRTVLEAIGQAAFGLSLEGMAASAGKDRSDYLVVTQHMKCVPSDVLTRTVLIVHP